MVNELNGSYEFYIFCSNSDLNGELLQIDKTNEWVTYNASTKVWYDNLKHPRKNIKEKIGEIKPDYLLMIGLYSTVFTIFPLFFAKAPIKIISVRGMLHPGALTVKPTKKKIFISLLKLMGIEKRCVFHATDPQEVEYIQKQFGNETVVHIAGNFPRKMNMIPLPIKVAGKLRLISIALISPMKNILLIIDSLKECKSFVHYDIYGPVKDFQYWEMCKKAIESLPENITVKYHSELSPLNVAAKLGLSQVFILPSKSENFGHSICEALSAGLPVLTSRFTPWNGLSDANAGINVDLVQNDINEAIERFAQMGQQEYESWSIGAVKYAESHLNINNLKQSYRLMFSQDT